MGNLRFGNVYTKDLDLIIQTTPTYNFPEKDVTIEHIPGRNGDLIIDNKCWRNVERTYSLASVFRPGTDFISNAEKFIKFLTSNPGYNILEDSYDPKVYRKAMYNKGGSLSNLVNEATTLDVTFICKPQRYLKSGNDNIHFEGSLATLENPTGYGALPRISINNITNSKGEVLLLTVKNIQELKKDITSTITLTDLPFDNITLDSELQEISENQNGKINKYVNLNNSQFPVLDKGITEIYIKKYLEKENIISKYETVIGDNKKTCLALHKPAGAIIESKQKSYYIKSYNLLKQQMSDVYEAGSYTKYCLEKSNSHTFVSYNTVLNDTSFTYTFQTDYSSKPEWLNINTVEGGDIVVSLSGSGLSNFFKGIDEYNKNTAFVMTNDSKKINKFTDGQEIGRFKPYATATITMYPANLEGNIYANYNDVGSGTNDDWIDCHIIYDESGAPIKIEYVTLKEGYFYLPKSGLFGKAGWKLLTPNQILVTLSWSSYKKAFMPSGLSASPSASYIYYYMNKNELPQYEDLYKDVLNKDGSPKKDSNGNPIQELASKVHFYINSTDSKLSSISFYAKDDGYYRCNDSDQATGWKYYTKDSLLEQSVVKINNDSNSTNVIYYMADKPNYSRLKDFPDWIDPDPILYNNSGDVINQSDKNINAKYYDFKIKMDSWYKYSYLKSGNDNYTDWEYRSSGSILGEINPKVDKRITEESFTAYRLPGESGAFPIEEYSYTDENGKTIKDIGFFYIGPDGKETLYPNNKPPHWLKVLIDTNDDTAIILKFITNAKGVYNWDRNTVWLNKESGQEIVTTLNLEDTKINYLEKLPEYPTYDRYDIQVNFDLKTGNPEGITVFAKQSGYFKNKNESDWKYINKSEKICESKTTETTIIRTLEESSNQLNNVNIDVIPRWWML